MNLKSGWRWVAAVVALSCLWAGAALAQPAGWTRSTPITITAGASPVPAGYQIRIVVDTAAVIGAGDMRPDGGDLRFAADANGASPLQYYIGSGLNTTATVIFVRTPAIAASQQRAFYMFSGNPGAAGQSDPLTFDYVSLTQNSSLQQTTGGNAGGVPDSQRSHRFIPNDDVLLVSLGGRVPTTGVRTINVFDFDSQAILRSADVNLTAGLFAFEPVAPLLLNAGQTYLINVHTGPVDGYYFGAPSSDFHPLLGYQDMRYCNGCTATTFPVNYLNNILYGNADFEFRSRVQLASPPTYALNVLPVETVPLSPWMLSLLALAILGMGGMAIRRRSGAPGQPG